MLQKSLLKKWLYVCVIFSLLSWVSCQTDEPEKKPEDKPEVKPDKYEPMATVSAIDYFRNKGINVGLNIGNSLDAYNSMSESGETAWGNPPITQVFFNGVKTSGFDLVRIPITWLGHVGPAPDYEIEEKLMERVAEVVGYAKNAGLVAVINFHHDGSTESSSKEIGWLSINKALANDENKLEITAKFESMWKQIAAHFETYGDYLIFEAFNELHDGRWFWESRNVPDAQYKVINEWNQVFTDAVRGTGGNNRTRYLVIPGYCAGAEALFNNNFEMPNDTAPDRLIVAFHYYRPDDFALNGRSENWGTPAEKTTIDTLFGRMKTQFIDNNIPVFIGETGPIRNSTNPPSDTAKQNRLDYIAYMFGKAKENELVPAYWDNGNFGNSGERFGLINRYNGRPQNEECTAVVETMINAIKN